MKRVFLALWPEDKIRQQVVKISNCLNASNMTPVKPNNLHVTLAFIGSVNDATLALIKRQVTNIAAKPFCIIFDQLSFWRKPKILCLSSSNPPFEIMQLAQVIFNKVSACGVNLDTREYRTHVTLARHANIEPKLDFAPIAWQADAICLVESVSATDGHDYKVLESWSFC